MTEAELRSLIRDAIIDVMMPAPRRALVLFTGGLLGFDHAVEGLRLLVADVASAYAVDPDRVYAAGHSNGGIMALRLACEASDVFAAVGVQSSALGITTCEPRNPVSLLQIHGTADTNVPIDGGRGSGLADVDFRPAKQTCAACGVIPERAAGTWLRLCPRCQGPLGIEGGDELDVLNVTFEEPDAPG